MIIDSDLNIVRDKMKQCRIFHHEGYSGPATEQYTVTVMKGKFFIISAKESDKWHESVDSVMDFLLGK